MKYYENQLNLGNIYSECADLFREQRPEFLDLMNNYIDINSYISYEFRKAFYADTGRPRECSLYGYISALIFQKIFTVPTDTLLIIILKLSSELRNFCGISNVPDASKFTRFKQDFCKYLEAMFNDLVEITEPICQAINPELASILSSDTSAVESYVTENNPKYINSIINKLKSYLKFKNISKSDDDIYKQAYKSMPKVSEADPSIRKMYANGHFCYGRKFGIITNGLGITRHIQFFDEEFKSKHSDFIFEDTDSPNYDKTLSDSKSIKPMLTDFYSLHPTFSHKIFLGDSAYDAAHVYEFLLGKNSDGNSLFEKAIIPLNSRATTDKPDCPINEDGVPVCPKDSSLKMHSDGITREKRSYY